jgi:hypothetical protein
MDPVAASGQPAENGAAAQAGQWTTLVPELRVCPEISVSP